MEREAKKIMVIFILSVSAAIIAGEVLGFYLFSYLINKDKQ